MFLDQAQSRDYVKVVQQKVFYALGKNNNEDLSNVWKDGKMSCYTGTKLRGWKFLWQKVIAYNEKWRHLVWEGMHRAVKHPEWTGTNVMMKDIEAPDKEIKMEDCEEYITTPSFYVISGSNLSFSAYSGRESWSHFC